MLFDVDAKPGRLLFLLFRYERTRYKSTILATENHLSFFLFFRF